MVINTSWTICHLFVSTGSLSVETPALVGCIEKAVVIRESWVEVVTSTRPGDSISMRSLYGGCATLVSMNMGGTWAMQRVHACFVESAVKHHGF